VPNYLAPSFRVEINGSQLAADVSKNIQELSITTKPDSLDTFSFVLANAYPALRWTHTSDADLFKEAASVRIGLGYVDDIQVVFNGEITKISPDFPENGAPSAVIEGHTRLHWLQSNRKTRTFQSMTDSQIVQRIAQEAGLSAQVEDTQVQHAYVMQPNQTDLDFIRARAQMIHFEVLVDDRTLIFRKSKETEEKIFTLVWGHVQRGFSPGPNTLPLKSFSPSMNTLNQPSLVTVRGYDPATKEAVIGTAAAGDEEKKLGASAGSEVMQSAFQRAREMTQVGALASQAEIDQQAKALYNERIMRFIRGFGATLGVPALRAGKIVELLGVGPRFSGLYYIEEATHTIGAGGFETSFTVKRNAA
jgi:uncharacterized protein